MSNRIESPFSDGSPGGSAGAVSRGRTRVWRRAARMRVGGLVRRRKRVSKTKVAAVGLAVVLAATALWLATRPPPALRVTFLDVGQGDAVLIQAPGRKTVLVDAGRSSPVADLRRLGVREIDLLVASHAHADHIGGMDDVLEYFVVRKFMDNGRRHTSQTYERLMDAVDAERGLTYLRAEPRTLELGDAWIQVLPLPDHRYANHNNRSVALVVRYGEFSVLLSGDSERGQLNFMTRSGVVPDVTVLKAPHHGDNDGFTQSFLEAVRPEVIVVSVGNNSYGHPGAVALAAFEEIGAHILRTDQDGTVTVVGRRDGSYQVRRR